MTTHADNLAKRRQRLRDGMLLLGIATLFALLGWGAWWGAGKFESEEGVETCQQLSRMSFIAASVIGIWAMLCISLRWFWPYWTWRRCAIHVVLAGTLWAGTHLMAKSSAMVITNIAFRGGKPEWAWVRPVDDEVSVSIRDHTSGLLVNTFDFETWYDARNPATPAYLSIPFKNAYIKHYAFGTQDSAASMAAARGWTTEAIREEIKVYKTLQENLTAMPSQTLAQIRGVLWEFAGRAVLQQEKWPPKPNSYSFSVCGDFRGSFDISPEGWGSWPLKCKSINGKLWWREFTWRYACFDPYRQVVLTFTEDRSTARPWSARESFPFWVAMIGLFWLALLAPFCYLRRARP
jgi:hypothetical protein